MSRPYNVAHCNSLGSWSTVVASCRTFCSVGRRFAPELAPRRASARSSRPRPLGTPAGECRHQYGLPPAAATWGSESPGPGEGRGARPTARCAERATVRDWSSRPHRSPDTPPQPVLREIVHLRGSSGWARCDRFAGRQRTSNRAQGAAALRDQAAPHLDRTTASRCAATNTPPPATCCRSMS